MHTVLKTSDGGVFGRARWVGAEPCFEFQYSNCPKNPRMGKQAVFWVEAWLLEKKTCVTDPKNPANV